MRDANTALLFFFSNPKIDFLVKPGMRHRVCPNVPRAFVRALGNDGLALGRNSILLKEKNNGNVR
jgi:hypothetical protein